jgi:hypothetical protein
MFMALLKLIHEKREVGLVISTFGLAEIINCIPNGLVNKYIGY